jgi:PAS domain S-box-containing protein
VAKPIRMPWRLAVVFFILMAPFWQPLAGAETIRVGIYQNPPKVFWNGRGKPQGIFVDIMNQIARNEGWMVEYAPGTWSQNLERLEKGELDLVLDVTYSQDRAEKFSFNKISVIESWLQAFAGRDVKLESARDLDGKRIAVLKGAIQEEYLPQEIKGLLNIDFTVLSYPDYAGTLEALRKGQADVIIASRFFYFSDLRGKDILPTSVMFRPSLVYFAFPRGRSDRIINRIDRNLSGMKNDPGSVYYRSINKWLGERPRAMIPRYMKWIFGVLIGGLALMAIFGLVLRRQVKARTAEITQYSQDLKDSSALLGAVFDVIPDILGIQDAEHGVEKYNRAGYEFLKCSHIDIKGKKCFQLIKREKPCDNCATAIAIDTKKTARVEKYFKDLGVWIDARSYPVLDEGGQVTKVVEHLRDITEQKQAEQALLEKHQALLVLNQRLTETDEELQASDEELKQQLAELQASRDELLATEEKYRSLFESTGTAMLIIDEDTTISLANAEMEKLSGYSRGEIEGKMKWTEFVSKPDLERMREYHLQRRQDPNAAPRSYEFRFIDRIGMIKDIFLSVDMIPGTGKSVASLVDITKRKSAELQVKASLREKEVLLREIYHRVKNNLQVVSSLLSLQSGYVHDPRDKEIFLESQNRIRSMSLVHENLYKSSNLAKIDFGHYVRNLVSDLIRSYGIPSDQLALTLDINDMELGVDVAIPCGLMINEMVSNSLKHAFKRLPPGGRKWEITVRFKLEGDVLYRLEVADNGTGFADKSDPLSEPATLGLQLITVLAEQLDGKVAVHHEHGTRYVVEFRKVA